METRRSPRSVFVRHRPLRALRQSAPFPPPSRPQQQPYPAPAPPHPAPTSHPIPPNPCTPQTPPPYPTPTPNPPKRPTPSHLRHNPAPEKRVKRAAVAPRASSGAGGSPRPAGDPKDAFEFVAFLYSSPEPCAGRGSVPRTDGRISASGFL